MDEALARERERKTKSMKMRSARYDTCIHNMFCYTYNNYYRHSRFGGTFVVKNQRSISGNDRVYHRPITGVYIQSVLGYIHF